MFIGHYAPALALKSTGAPIPLWHYFVAVQFLDYLWATFILTGIEKARITPGFLDASSLDLYFMPYTHSLAAAACWALAGAAVYRFQLNKGAGAAGAMLIGAAIFSHWIADLLVHAKDLALYPGSTVKLGFGLWDSVPISQSLEAAIFVLGAVLYYRSTKAAGAAGVLALGLVIAAPAAIQLYNQIGEPPGDIRTLAALTLVVYTALALIAALADRTRGPKRRLGAL